MSFWVLQCINGAGDLVLVVEMLLGGLSQPGRATAFGADFGRNLGSLRRSNLAFTSEEASAPAQ